jgi:hypothetical protein
MLRFYYQSPALYLNLTGLLCECYGVLPDHEAAAPVAGRCVCPGSGIGEMLSSGGFGFPRQFRRFNFTGA